MWTGLLLANAIALLAAPGDWPEPRHDARLTGGQPAPGRMTSAPAEIARLELGRARPAIAAAAPGPGEEPLGLAVVSGALHAYDASGALRWRCHPPGLEFTQLALAEDLDGDARPEALLMAGRPGWPLGAVALVDLGDGALRWRYDVEPMSYAWRLHAGHYLPGAARKQFVVLMQGYPPDAKNGYLALFAIAGPGAAPQQRWRYDFDQYTCFPELMQTDLEGDGTRELAVVSHSRLWLLDAVTGARKQFHAWDVAPANVRSYGYNRFADLNGDGLEDFLCIADFAQHHEVLLNHGGLYAKSWHQAWDASVTTGKIDTAYPDPPYADLDGDGTAEVVLAMYNLDGNGAWTLRIYDGATGDIRAAMPGLVPVRIADLDGDARPEIVANACSEPSRTVMQGARAIAWRGGAPAVAWQDDACRALAPAEFAGGGAAVYMARGEERLALTLGAQGAARLEAYAPPPPAPDPWAAVPACVGGAMPELLAADLDGNGRNELIAYAGGRATAYALDGAALVPGPAFDSDALPAIADLDGDGALEVVTIAVQPDATPIVEARTPSQGNALRWRCVFPATDRSGLPQRPAYLRTGRFTGRAGHDVYVWAGVPLARSAVLDGATGALVWERGELPGLERFYGPSVNLASAFDADADGADDLVFTAPDYYCIASGRSGDLIVGPLFPPEVFKQPSQGLYTAPAILDDGNPEPLAVLGDGHYFQAALRLRGAPLWHALPAVGEAPAGCEAFLRGSDGAWRIGFGRQDGRFACLDAATGAPRWEYDLAAKATDAIAGDLDGDGSPEFLFGTGHGALIALGERDGAPRELWRLQLDAAPGPPILADLDGGAAPEIALAAADGTLRVFAAR